MINEIDRKLTVFLDSTLNRLDIINLYQDLKVLIKLVDEIAKNKIPSLSAVSEKKYEVKKFNNVKNVDVIEDVFKHDERNSFSIKNRDENRLKKMKSDFPIHLKPKTDTNKYSLIAEGKVKNVWTTSDSSPYVFFTAKKGGVFDWLKQKNKEAELKDEVRIAKNIDKEIFVRSIKSMLTDFHKERLNDDRSLAIDKDAINTSATLLAKKFNSINQFVGKMKALSRNKALDELNPPLDFDHANHIIDFCKDSEKSSQYLKIGQHIATELEQVKESERVDNLYTIKTEKALSDMEKYIREPHLTFHQRIDLCLQFFQGMNDLHESGYVHGDLKPENLLVYNNQKESGVCVKISDFGKTQQIRDTESRIHTGNPRYLSYEGRTSKSNEVFSSALIAVRILEEEFLSDEEDQLKTDDHIEDVPINVKAVDKKRRGIEKFIVSNENCPQCESRTLSEKIDVGRRQLQLHFKPNYTQNRYKEAEKSIHHYIQRLTNKIREKYPANETQINELETLLCNMTKEKSNMERPTMRDVCRELKRIKANINPIE